jgi:hypothetical protein
MIVSEYGTELTSNVVLAWCGEIGVEWHYIVRWPENAKRNRTSEKTISPCRGNQVVIGSSVGLVSINALVFTDLTNFRVVGYTEVIRNRVRGSYT